MGTYKYSDLTSLISKSFNKQFLDDNAATIANMATNKIWMRYDWRESISALPPIYIEPLVQDIVAPPTIVPADFAGLREVKIRSIDGRFGNCSTLWTDTPLSIERDLEPTEGIGIPRCISYVKELDGFRLHPTPNQNFTAPYYFLVGRYKKLPTKITSTTLNTLLPFDDIYFQVWIEVARWGALTLLGDPRAGGSNGTSNQKFVNGQLAIAEAAIDSMAIDQGLNSGDESISPAEPLWGGGNGYIQRI